MNGTKKSIWFDLALIFFGVITLLLLFMPEYYLNYRYAGFGAAGVFLILLIFREYRRKRAKKMDEEV